jgi:hypothetical protein
MAFFNDIKNQLKGINKNVELNSQTELLDDDLMFELEEARYMLNLIANSNFPGRDVQMVYNIALKLQDIIKNKK